MVRQRTSAPAAGGPSKRAKTNTGVSMDDPANRLLQSNTFSVLQEENGDGDAVAITKKERIPPLFTPMKDVGTLVVELSKLKLQPRFKLCSIGTKIMCSNLEEYKSVGGYLKDSGLEFYTHDLPSVKPLKVVLRGLPPFKAADVLSELEQLGLKPVAVYPITRRPNSNTSFRDQLFLVHFPKGSTTIGQLKSNIKDLFQVIISWESYRPQHRDATQCANCLAFGHGTKNCHMKSRCDKCAKDHPTASCEQSDDVEVKCSNCGGNHRASNRDCPKRAQFIEIRRKASTSNQPGRRRNVPAFTDGQFPALQPRRVVPNLAPLPLNVQRRPAQHRLAAAAAQPNQGPSSAPGLSFAGAVSGEAADDSPFTSEELVTLVAEVIIIMRTCKTRTEQLLAAVSLVNKYGP